MSLMDGYITLSPYQQGQKAFLYDKREDENPYCMISECYEFFQWENGWRNKEREISKIDEQRERISSPASNG